MKERILIVDNHPAVRMAAKLTLAENDFNVVAEVGDGALALRLIRSLDPTVIVMDINIPTVDGLTMINEIHTKKLPIKIVVYTGAPSYNLAYYCRQMGVQGVLSKQCELSELINAINAVLDGDEYFPEFWPSQPREYVDGKDVMSPRTREVNDAVGGKRWQSDSGRVRHCNSSRQNTSFHKKYTHLLYIH